MKNGLHYLFIPFRLSCGGFWTNQKPLCLQFNTTSTLTVTNHINVFNVKLSRNVKEDFQEKKRLYAGRCPKGNIINNTGSAALS